jgi:hypothetical protein
MEVLAIIGILLILLAIFTGGGILGWILRGIQGIFSLLAEGWSNIFGCLFWVFIIILVLVGLLL